MPIRRSKYLRNADAMNETIMHSLKIARLLLASVAYFVLFAMALFSYVPRSEQLTVTHLCLPQPQDHRKFGIQSFSGSLRRSCYLAPTLGEPEAQLSHFCGGFIDPTTLSVVPYITQDRQNGTVKGYICPLGQTCKVCIVPRPMSRKRY
jgi:voltage-dependent calcium channel